jgi:large subunit ribosomal protein L4
MAQIPVYDADGREVRRIELDESDFGGRLLTKTLHGVVVSFARNKRQGTAHAKTRGEVSGSNKKLWKQKGTGRARVGDRRPPNRTGGGVSHGPRNHSFYRPIPVKLRTVALGSALVAKLRDGSIALFEGLDFADGPKTSRMAKFMAGSGTPDNSLIAVGGLDQNFVKSVRNLPRTVIREAREVNAYEVMKARRLVLSTDALEALKSRVAAKAGE